jgi:uncharacterized protein YigE (DUF2233 family)
MNLLNLQKEVNKWVDRGYGPTPVYVEDGQEKRQIDSIQSNTNPGIRPNYLFVMADEAVG